MGPFVFNTYPLLTDGEIDLRVAYKMPGEPAEDRAPAYHFRISQHSTGERIGTIDLRIGYTPFLVCYAGHIGYRIDPAHRGHRYAAKACRLVKPVAWDHGMDVLWITCNPDNWPSRRTCELLGCELVDIVDLPEDNDMYLRGERQKCRYRWVLD